MSIIFLLIASVVCTTNFNIYNIEINKRFLFDPLEFPSSKIPIGTYYLRIPVEDIHMTSIKFTVKQNAIHNFKVNISVFYEHPTDSEILNGTNNIQIEYFAKYNTNKLTNYVFRVPQFQNERKIKYLVVTILNYEVLDFLSVYVFPKQSHDDFMDYTVYNINYMKEEILNQTTLNQHKGYFIFLVENEELRKNKLIRIKLNKEYSERVYLEFAGYKERPIFEEDFRNPPYADDGKIKLPTKDDDYKTYEYLLENPVMIEQKYLAFFFEEDMSESFISFYVGPES